MIIHWKINTFWFVIIRRKWVLFGLWSSVNKGVIFYSCFSANKRVHIRSWLFTEKLVHFCSWSSTEIWVYFGSCSCHVVLLFIYNSWIMWISRCHVDLFELIIYLFLLISMLTWLYMRLVIYSHVENTCIITKRKSP